MGQAVALLLEKVAPLEVAQVGSAIVLLATSLICGLLYFLLTSGFIAGAMALSNWDDFVPLCKRSLAWAPVTLSGVAFASILFSYLN